jgi:hypothetical protein
MTFNHEVVGSYNITVTVVDPEGLNDTETLTVYITDVNDPPSLTFTALNVSENRAVGSVVTGKVTGYDEDEAYLATLGFTPRLRYALVMADPSWEGPTPFAIHPVSRSGRVRVVWGGCRGGGGWGGEWMGVGCMGGVGVVGWGRWGVGVWGVGEG